MNVSDLAAGLPASLMINAFAPVADGELAARSNIPSSAAAWILRNSPPEVRTFLRPQNPADPRDWHDARVGWGIILPDRDDLSDGDRRTANDAPEPIRELVRARGPAPVFRYRAEKLGVRYLRDSANECDVSIASAPTGIGKGYLPRYLLLYGDPDVLPWSLQYVLNAKRCVGRLHLQGEALERYVRALLDGWPKAQADNHSTVVWATSHDPLDITRLIRDVIAEPLAQKYLSDPDITRHAELFGEAATHTALVDAVTGGKPAMVVTTSHGHTWPTDDRAALAASLGLPIDAQLRTLDVDALLHAWQPDGAIWYAHACCSAGSDGVSAFRGLVDEKSSIAAVLEGVAALGARVAPLPTALLSAAKPARAFVGHVEPTFDWSVQDPQSGQPFSDDVTTAFYDRLFLGHPLGLAIRPHYGRLAGLFSEYDASVRRFNKGADTMPALLSSVLVARDVQSMVLLGDPTVAICDTHGEWVG